MKSVATIYARIIGIAVCLYGGWMFLGNAIVAVLGEAYTESWILLLVLAAAAVGVAGAILFLLSFDGPSRWRTSVWRIVGWAGMLLCVLLPTSLSFFLLPLVGLAALTLAMKAKEEISEQVGATN